MKIIQLKKMERGTPKFAVRVEDIFMVEETECPYWHVTITVDNHCGGTEKIECCESFENVIDSMCSK